MKKIFLVSLVCLNFIFIQCKKVDNANPIIPDNDELPEKKQFPEVFIETGSDVDTTYIAMETSRTSTGILKIVATGWAIEEYGLFLNVMRQDTTLSLMIMGMCGTVPTLTWVKKSFTYSVHKSIEDSLQVIKFTGWKGNKELLITKRR